MISSPAGGGLHRSLGALKDIDPELFLEFLDLTAEYRLTDVTGFGGTTEMLVLVHRNHVLEITDIHLITINYVFITFNRFHEIIQDRQTNRI